MLLREAMQTTGTVGIARAVIRGRQYLIALMPEQDAIIADRLRFKQELTNTTELDLPTGSLREYNVSAQELDMAEKLVEAMESEWQPESYRDEYRDILLNWIEKKARTGEMVPQEEEVPEVKEQGKQVNITELLQRSLEEARNK